MAALLAALPVAGLAPWTGWMLVEEFDLMLLALLAGSFARLVAADGPLPRPAADGAARVWWLLVVVYVAVAGVSVWRGLLDAGAWTGDGQAWHWWHGWQEPLNVLRTIKPLVWALLAWPLWQLWQAREPEAAADALGWGAGSGLAVVAILASWERWAWTGLVNFTTDYRTTALFWETHIGGAGLDGFLALTLPFALWAAWRVKSNMALSMAIAVLCLAGYAILTTFSRGLYLGVAVGVLVWWAMTARRTAMTKASSAVFAVWVLLFGLAAVMAFSSSGWRGLGALWGLAAVLLWGGRGAPDREVGQGGRRLLAMVGGLLAATPIVSAALAVPMAWKAPYLLYAGCAGLAVLAWYPSRRHDLFGWAAWGATAAAAVGVAVHWGEGPGRWVMAGGVLVMATMAALSAHLPAWRGPAEVRWRMALLGALAVTGFVAGSFGGGRYLEGRLAAAGGDWQVRMDHWSRSLSLADDGLSTWLGIGTGRFAAHFALSGQTTDQVGDYRWQPREGGGTLVLTSGKHTLGFGELFRMSQRIDAPVGGMEVRWRAAVETPVRLHVEVCSKHLLYDNGCSAAEVPLRPRPVDPADGWQAGQLVLKAMPHWQQPVFSVALSSRGGWIRLDEIEVTDSLGRSLLHNGGFDEGLARWLPSSDRYHLPWHAKNLGLHLRIEQGWLGLIGFTALLAFAIARLTLGRARRHPLAPPLLAGIVGFLIVGAFDSLLDIPRVAFAFLWLLGVAATLRAPGPAATVPGPTPVSRSGPR
ncbi:MAG: hypothetical protein H6933_18580 [Burkholderiaceae bacterium]|nr:hypothetical protein [Burkholderiaceae bacterium]